MDRKQLQQYERINAAFREKVAAEAAARKTAAAAAAAATSAGAAKAASALVDHGIVAESRRADVEAALRDPVKAHAMVGRLAEKLAAALSPPPPIGEPAAPTVKAASAASAHEAEVAQQDAAWSRSLAAAARFSS